MLIIFFLGQMLYEFSKLVKSIFKKNIFFGTGINKKENDLHIRD
jgi:hypothetical protein